jgi:hypothetical protein
MYNVLKNYIQRRITTEITEDTEKGERVKEREA